MPSYTPVNDMIRQKLANEHPHWKELRRKVTRVKLPDSREQHQACITLEKERKLPILHRVGKCAKMSLFTLGSLFTALFFQGVRDGWEEVYTGREIKHIIVPFPTSEEAKVSDLFSGKDSSLDLGNPAVSLKAFQFLNTGALGFKASSAKPFKDACDILLHFLPKMKEKFNPEEGKQIDACLQDFQEGLALHDWVCESCEKIKGTSSPSSKLTLQKDSIKTFKDKLKQKLEKQKSVYLPLTWDVNGEGHLIKKLIGQGVKAVFAQAGDSAALAQAASLGFTDMMGGNVELDGFARKENAPEKLNNHYSDAHFKLGNLNAITKSHTLNPLTPSISLELFLKEEYGEKFISGRVINLGPGVKSHQKYPPMSSTTQLEKLKVAPVIQLPPIPFADFDEGYFMDYLFQFQLPELILPSGDGSVEEVKEANATASDFYQSVLGAWSKDTSTSPYVDPGIWRVAQRGKFGALKLFWNHLYFKLGEENGKLLKFYVTLAALKVCFAQHQLGENHTELSQALKKVNQRAVKLKNKGMISEEEIRELDKFNEECKKKLDSREKKLETGEGDTPLQNVKDNSWQFEQGLPWYLEFPQEKGIVPPDIKVSNLKKVGVEAFVSNHASILSGRKHLNMDEEQKQLATYTLEQIPEACEDEWEKVTDPMKLIADLRTLQQVLAENVQGAEGRLVLTPQQACLWIKTSVIILRFCKNSVPLHIFEAFAARLYLHVRDGLSMFFAPLKATNALSFQQSKDYIFTLLMEGRDPDPKTGEKSTKFEIFKGVERDIAGKECEPQNLGKHSETDVILSYWHNEMKKQTNQSSENINLDSTTNLTSTSSLDDDPELAYLMELHKQRRSLWHIFTHGDFQSGIDRLFEGFCSSFLPEKSVEYMKVSTEYSRRRESLTDSEYGKKMHAYQALRDACNYVYLGTDVSGKIRSKEDTFPWSWVNSYLPFLKPLQAVRENPWASWFFGREKSHDLSFSLSRTRILESFTKNTQFTGVVPLYDDDEKEGGMEDAYNYGVFSSAFPEFMTPELKSARGFSSTKGLREKTQDIFEEWTQMFLAGHYYGYLEKRKGKITGEDISTKTSTKKFKQFQLYHQNHLSSIDESLNLIFDRKRSFRGDNFRCHPFTPSELQDLFSIHTAGALSLSQIEHFFKRIFSHMYKEYYQSLLLCFLFKPDGDGKTPLLRSLETGKKDKQIDSFLSFIDESLDTACDKFNRTYLFYLRLYTMTLTHLYVHKAPKEVYDSHFKKLLDRIKMILSNTRHEESLKSVGVRYLDTVLLSIFSHLSDLPHDLRDNVIACIHLIRRKIGASNGGLVADSDPHLCEDRSRAEFLIENIPDFQTAKGEPKDREDLPAKYRTGDFSKLFGSFVPYCIKRGPGDYEFDEGLDTYRIHNGFFGYKIYRLMVDERGEKDWYCYYDRLPVTRKESAFSIKDLGYDHQAQEALLDPEKGPLFHNTEFWVKTGKDRKVLVCDSSHRQLKKALQDKEDELSHKFSFYYSPKEKKEREQNINTIKVQKAQLSKKKNIIRCVITREHIVHPDDPNLVLAYNFSHPLLRVIGRLDPSNPLWVWGHKKTREIQKIELAKLSDCSFYAVKDDRGKVEWKSAAFHGYCLDTCQKNTFFHPFPCLTLVHENGSRKVFLPTIQGQNEQKLSFVGKKINYLARKFKQNKIPGGTYIDFALNLMGIDCPQQLTHSSMIFSYDFNSLGELQFPSSGKNLMFFIYLMFVKGDVERANKALQSLKRIPDLGGSEEWEILDLLAKLIPSPYKPFDFTSIGNVEAQKEYFKKSISRDKETNTTLANSSPEQLAFLLQLDHYLCTHPIFSLKLRDKRYDRSRDEDSDPSVNWKDMYDMGRELMKFYINKFNNIPISLRFSREEWVKLSDFFYEGSFSILKESETTLPDNPPISFSADSSSAHSSSEGFDSNTLFLSPSIDENTEKMMFTCRSKPLSCTSSLRQGKLFLYNFLYYTDLLDALFKHAIEPYLSAEELTKHQEEKEKLIDLLKACQNDADPLVKSCSNFLRAFIRKVDCTKYHYNDDLHSRRFFSETLALHEQHIKAMPKKYKEIREFLKGLEEKESHAALKQYIKESGYFKFKEVPKDFYDKKEKKLIKIVVEEMSYFTDKMENFFLYLNKPDDPINKGISHDNEKGKIKTTLTTTLRGIYNSQEQDEAKRDKESKQAVITLAGTFERAFTAYEKPKASACTRALHYFYQDQLKGLPLSYNLFGGAPLSSDPFPPVLETDLGAPKFSTLLEPPSTGYVEAPEALSIEEKEDRLLEDLSKPSHSLVYLSSPSDKALEKLKLDIQTLAELQHFYHNKKVEFERQKEKAIARDFSRLLDGVSQKKRFLEAKLTKMQTLKDSRDVPIETTNPHISYEIEETNIASTVDYLKSQIDQEKKELSSVEQKILETLKPADIDNRLLLNAGILPTLDLSQALIYYARGQDGPFYEANPGLTPGNLKTLKRDISTYLIDMLNLQKKQRFFKELTKLQVCKERKDKAKDKASKAEYDILKDKCIDILKQKRSYLSTEYDSREQRSFMVFERFADICLREEQLLALKKIQEEKDIILEARTGFGKSKALIPLWLYLVSSSGDCPEFTGRGKIAMMTVTKALYTQQDQYLKSIMGGAFDKMVFSFEFTRDMGKRYGMKDLDYLTWLRDSLIKSRKEGLIVLTTIGSLHSLMNLKTKEYIYELVSKDKNKSDIYHALELLKDIRKIIKDDALNFIDESRECLDIRCYYDYSAGGTRQQISMARAHHFESAYLELLKMSEGSFNLDFLPNAKEDQKAITEEYFEENIKEKLAKKFLQVLGSLGINTDVFQANELFVIEKHFKGIPLSHADKEIIKKYIVRPPDNWRPRPAETVGELLEYKLLEHMSKGLRDKPAFRCRAKNGPSNDKSDAAKKVEKILNYYAAFRNQLNTYLPRTLTRPCNGRYGLVLSEGHRFAFPFDKGVPKLSSEFATIDDYLNFTLQANLKEFIGLDVVNEFIMNLKSKENSREELSNSEKNRELFQKELFSLLVAAMPMPPKEMPANVSDCKEKHLRAMHEVLNNPKHIDLKLKFICRFILPQIRVSLKKLTNNVHNLISGMGVTYGASGTVNDDTLPLKLKTHADPTTPIGSIISMWRDSRTDIKYLPKYVKDVHRKDSRPANATDLFIKALDLGSDYRVIIDLGGTYRDLKNPEEIARIVFDKTKNWKPPINAFSFYDDNGENLVYQRLKPGETALSKPINRSLYGKSEENIFVFMRQSTVIGADTPMTATAKALVTVGKDTVRDLYLQGVGRMRGILTGQKVSFLIEEQDKSFFQSRQIDDIAVKVFEKRPSIKAFSFYDEDGQQQFYLPFYTEGVILLQVSTSKPSGLDEKDIFHFMTPSEPSDLSGWKKVGSKYYFQNLPFEDERITPIFKDGCLSFSSDQPPSLSNIFTLVGVNQGKQKGQDMFFNLSIVLQSLIEKCFWSYFESLDFRYIHHTKPLMLEKWINFMLEETIMDPMSTIDVSPQNLTFDEAINLLKDSFQSKVRRYGLDESISMMAIMDEFDEYCRKNSEKLPHKIRTSIGDSDRDTEVEAAFEVDAQEEVEVTAEKQSENEIDQQSERECRVSLGNYGYKPAVAMKPGHYKKLSATHSEGRHKLFFAHEYFTDSFSSLFKDVFMTRNYYYMQASEGSGIVEGGPAEGRLKLSYNYLVIKEETGTYSLVFLDQADSGAFMQDMIDSKKSAGEKRDFYLLNSNGKVICSDARDTFSFEKTGNPLFGILCKVFSRYFVFDEKESKYLKLLCKLFLLQSRSVHLSSGQLLGYLQGLQPFLDSSCPYSEIIEDLTKRLEKGEISEGDAYRELMESTASAWQLFTDFENLLTKEIGPRLKEEELLRELFEGLKA